MGATYVFPRKAITVYTMYLFHRSVRSWSRVHVFAFKTASRPDNISSSHNT